MPRSESSVFIIHGHFQTNGFHTVAAEASAKAAWRGKLAGELK